MILARWRARRANRILIEQIYGEIVAAARAPALYAHWAVADSLDGRFEMMALHAGLVTRRLDDLGDLGAQIAQDLVDCVFRHFEDALREMAIGDAGVVRRVKTMAAAFHGRNRAYGEALAARDAEALAAALARNVYGASEVLRRRARATSPLTSSPPRSRWSARRSTFSAAAGLSFPERWETRDDHRSLVQPPGAGRSLAQEKGSPRRSRPIRPSARLSPSSTACRESPS